MQRLVRRFWVAVIATGLFGVLLAGPALAQYTGVAPPNVGVSDPGVAVLGSRFVNAPVAPATETATARFAVTGGDVLGLLFLASVAVGVGIITVWVFRPVPTKRG